MKKALICSLACLAGCAALAGCREKPEGVQAIIIELADPSDAREAGPLAVAGSMPGTETGAAEEENVSGPDTEETSGESEEAEGEKVYLEYTCIDSNDPVAMLAAAGILPEGIKLEDFSVTNVQAYKGDEEIIPAGTVSFRLAVEDGAQVMLYRLDEDGELAAEGLEAVDGTVSYEAQGCGRWLVLDAVLEAETESVSGTDTEQ